MSVLGCLAGGEDDGSGWCGECCGRSSCLSESRIKIVLAGK